MAIDNSYDVKSEDEKYRRERAICNLGPLVTEVVDGYTSEMMAYADQADSQEEYIDRVMKMVRGVGIIRDIQLGQKVTGEKEKKLLDEIAVAAGRMVRNENK